MAGYGYVYGNGNRNGYGKANAIGRSLTRFQSWGMGNDRVEANDGWKSSFASANQVRRDHVCRPVIVGSDGRLIPGVLECPRNNKDAIVSDNYPDGEGHGKAKDFITNIQGVASNYNEVGHPGSRFDHQKVEYGTYDNGAYDKSSSTGWSKPVNNNGGWGWSASPAAQLGRATNDVETAAEFLGESARPEAMSVAHSDPWSTPSYAAEPWSTKSYSGYKPPKRSSATSIDSREAAKKYGGKFVW